jgi:hypothetical protein
MRRITTARMSFEGFRGNGDRASAISQRALRQVAVRVAGEPGGASAARVQVIVRAPHGASDAAIADRVADAITSHLTGRIASRRGTGA